MKNKIRKRLNKKERRATIMAREKNQRFVEGEMMREYLEGYEDDLKFLDHADPDDEETEQKEILEENADRKKDKQDHELEMKKMRRSCYNDGLMTGMLGMFLYAALLAAFFLYQKTSEEKLENLKETEVAVVETEALEEGITLDDFFGSAPDKSTDEKIDIYGLSDQAKKKYSFEEEEFQNAVSQFLNENGVDTDLLYLEHKVPVSSENAVGYIASMAGVTDQMLEVMIYPEFPGRYVFMLTEKVNEEIIIEKKAESTSNTVPETEAASVTLPNAGNVVPETSRVIYQTPQTDANTYDAERLHIKELPSDLKNYISSEKVLQYELYSFLYSNGHRKVRTAKVTEYSIDGDSRQADFRVGLDDGKTVACTYYHDLGTFHFS